MRSMESRRTTAGSPGPLWWALFIAWGAGLYLAAPWDLPLSYAVADLDGTFFTKTIQTWGTAPSGVLQLGAVLFLLVPGLRRRSQSLQVIAIIVVIMSLLHPLVITTAIKFLWGRIRFMHLVGEVDRFTPFWRINTPGAGTSFPSGHVATACSLSPVVVHLWWDRRRFASLVLGVIVAAWTLTVAWGRIAGGYHYLTDTLFSIGLSALLAPYVAAWAMRVWRRWPLDEAPPSG
jgi:membrane-associated phospholipid phosphatase